MANLFATSASGWHGVGTSMFGERERERICVGGRWVVYLNTALHT
jgi:hypothetical protein